MVSFGWIRKKKKNQVFLPWGYKGKKDGEEKSFPCLVLFISTGMKQSGLRAHLDGGLWHWCSSHNVVESVQVPNTAHSSKRSCRDAKPPWKVRGLHALQNPSSDKVVQLAHQDKKIEKLILFFFLKYPKAALPAEQSFWSIEVYLTTASFGGDGVENEEVWKTCWAHSTSPVFKRPNLIRNTTSKQMSN